MRAKREGPREMVGQLGTLAVLTEDPGSLLPATQRFLNMYGSSSKELELDLVPSGAL